MEGKIARTPSSRRWARAAGVKWESHTARSSTTRGVGMPPGQAGRSLPCNPRTTTAHRVNTKFSSRITAMPMSAPLAMTPPQIGS